MVATLAIDGHRLLKIKRHERYCPAKFKVCQKWCYFSCLKGLNLVFRKKLSPSLERKLLAMRERISEALKLVYSDYQFVRGGRRRFFRAFAPASAKQKKSAKKAKEPSAKEKTRIRAFSLHPQWKSGFRAQSRLEWGKARDAGERHRR
jgi:hypothetical protein